MYGDSTKQHTVALIVPNPQHLDEIAERQGLKGMEFEELCTSPVMEKAVVQELAEHGKKCEYLIVTQNFIGLVELKRKSDLRLLITN